jgi:hypothetical protein
MTFKSTGNFSTFFLVDPERTALIQNLMKFAFFRQNRVPQNFADSALLRFSGKTLAHFSGKTLLRSSGKTLAHFSSLPNKRCCRDEIRGPICWEAEDLMKFSLFGAAQLSPILFDLTKRCLTEEEKKIWLRKRPALMGRNGFGRTNHSLIWTESVATEAAPGGEPKSVLGVTKEAAEDEILKAEAGNDDASDDREQFNWRTAFGSDEMFERLEMSPEKIEGATAGFEATIAISERKNLDTEVFHTKPCRRFLKEL